MSTEIKPPSVLEEYLKSNPKSSSVHVAVGGASERIPASFVRRSVAKVIDFFILMMALLVPSFFVRNPSFSIPLLVLFEGLYAGYFLSRARATPGKKLMKIEVIRKDNGERLSFLHGALRDGLGHPISSLLGIGYLMALFSRERIALHDLIFGTRVVVAKED